MRNGIKAWSSPFAACSKVVAAVIVQMREREGGKIQPKKGRRRQLRAQQDREHTPREIKSLYAR
jgi:hypothetical protein